MKLTKEQKENYRKAKILVYDIEISPTLGWTYGEYDTNVLRVEKQPLLLSFSWKWLGSDEPPKCEVISKLEAEAWNDKRLVMLLRDLFDEANLLVGHNIDRFDNRVMTGKFIDWGLKPPSPCKSWDTLKMARKHKFGSNKLDALGNRFNEGRKTEVTHADVWYNLLFGTAEEHNTAEKLMCQYNNQDVALTEKIFWHLMPYYQTGITLGRLIGHNWVCDCGSTEGQFHGVAFSPVGKYRRWQCNRCGKWHKVYEDTKEDREEFNPKSERPQLRHIS